MSGDAITGATAATAPSGGGEASPGDLYSAPPHRRPSASLRQRKGLVHLIDLDQETDPLAALVVDGQSAVMRGHFEHRALCWRAAAQLFRNPPRFVVAWGERALGVARLGGVLGGIYRPWDNARPAPAAPGWRLAASSRAELQRFLRLGWAETQSVVVPPPGIDAVHRGRGKLTRRGLGIVGDDFVWLLSGDTTCVSGLRDAIWAGAIMHVMERDRRLHRILLWGDSSVQRGGRVFADQLGLPALSVAASQVPYHALCEVADAALLLPRSNGAWSAAVVALAGLPAVINGNAAVQEVLGRRGNVRISSGNQTRLVVREMLALVEDGLRRTAGDPSIAPERVRLLWDQAVTSALSAASGEGK